jgi:hypothetical protein
MMIGVEAVFRMCACCFYATSCKTWGEVGLEVPASITDYRTAIHNKSFRVPICPW